MFYLPRRLENQVKIVLVAGVADVCAFVETEPSDRMRPSVAAGIRSRFVNPRARQLPSAA